MEKVISRTIPTKVVYQIMTVSPTDGIKMGDLVEWDHEITTAAERDEILGSFGIAKGNLIEVDRKEENTLHAVVYVHRKFDDSRRV